MREQLEQKLVELAELRKKLCDEESFNRYQELEDECRRLRRQITLEAINKQIDQSKEEKVKEVLGKIKADFT